jgi:hypothetical protein
MLQQSLPGVRASNHKNISRRALAARLIAGAAGSTTLSWKDAFASQAAELRKRGMSCVFLFMRGAPSQFETFDPKPGTVNGGPTKAIDTAVSGIRIAEGWDNVAAQMQDISLIRSLTNNKEGNHDRAVYQLHTGYVQSQTVKHPSLGAIAAAELGPDDFDLPDFVTIGHRAGIIGSGFLGTSVAPFAVLDPTKTPNNIELPPGIAADRFTRRHALLQDLEVDFAETSGKTRVQNQQILYGNAKRMVLSPRLKAFDLSQEKDSVRDRYGRTDCGQGCLLARRTGSHIR